MSRTDKPKEEPRHPIEIEAGRATDQVRSVLRGGGTDSPIIGQLSFNVLRLAVTALEKAGTTAAATRCAEVANKKVAGRDGALARRLERLLEKSKKPTPVQSQQDPPPQPTTAPEPEEKEFPQIENVEDLQRELSAWLQVIQQISTYWRTEQESARGKKTRSKKQFKIVPKELQPELIAHLRFFVEEAPYLDDLHRKILLTERKKLKNMLGILLRGLTEGRLKENGTIVDNLLTLVREK